MTIQYAHDEHGISLPRTEHKSLPMMGEKGCTVAPHLRPWCTMHVCSINSLGFDINDLEWIDRYFELRDLITVEEMKRNESNKEL